MLEFANIFWGIGELAIKIEKASPEVEASIVVRSTSIASSATTRYP